MRPAPDLAILGARVRTLDPTRPIASAIAVRGGTIVAAGDDSSIRALCAGSTSLLDGRGLAIVPGLTDSHIHPFMGAELTRGADLSDAGTLDEVRARLAAERRRVGPGGWVRGWGLTFEPFQATGIRGDLLEEAVGGQPAYVGFFDGHTAVATKAALAMAGVAGPVQFEDQAAVVCDEEGTPTGELQEWGALALVKEAMPAPTAQERYARFVDAFRRFNAVGLTALHAMDGSPADFDLLREMEANGDLTARVVLPLWQKPAMSMEEMRAMLPLRDERGRRWRGGVAKFFLDGVVESGTAWLLEADSRGEGCLPYWPDPRLYAGAVAMFAGAGFRCATHAVGDAAVRWALDSYRAAGAAPGVRHRIEHIELVADADLPRFAAEGVVASMQPLHMANFEPDGSDVWGSRVGPDRLRRTFRCAELRASGAALALGSDWMVAPFDPRIGMAWARLRRPGGRPDRPVIRPEQALAGLQALEGYTTHAAWTVSEEAEAGRIAPGYRADLTAFAEDPVDIDPDELPALPVLMTMVDGEVVYRAAE